MSQFPFEKPAKDAKRAAESGAIGYNRETDDELRDLELGEGNINPGSQRSGSGAGGPGGMMPPMMGMMGRGGGAGAGAGGAGAMNAGMMGATASRAGSVPMGAAGGGVGPGVGAGGVSAGGVGAGGIGGVSGLGNFPRTGGTVAAGASGSGYSPYGINPATGLPWKPTDPGYPPTSGIGVPPLSVSPRSFDDIKPPVVTHPGINPPSISPTPGVGTPPIDVPAMRNPGIPTPPINSPIEGIKAPNPVDAPGIKAPTTPGVGPDPSLQNPDLNNPNLQVPSVQSPSISAPGGPGGVPTVPGGGGPSGPGGGGDGSYQVDPAELANVGNRWQDLAEQMTQVKQGISELKISLADFGLVTQPESTYRATQQRVEKDAEQTAKEFADNNTKLNSSVRAFEEAEDTNTQRAAKATSGAGGARTATANVATIN